MMLLVSALPEPDEPPAGDQLCLPGGVLRRAQDDRVGASVFPVPSHHLGESQNNGGLIKHHHAAGDGAFLHVAEGLVDVFKLETFGHQLVQF